MSTKDILAQALQDSKPTLVEFYKPGCSRCAMTMPIVDELKERQEGKANVIQINSAENADLVEKYHVHSYPTWILFRDGQEAWRDGGEKPLSELTDMLHRFE